MALKSTNASSPNFAGAVVTATGKYNPLSDGADGLALAVTLVDQSGGVVTPGGGGTATAAAPTYVEASSDPLSMNLTGDLRTISKITDGTTTATVAASATDGAAAALAGLRVYNRPMLYNGATYDIARGDATGGAWVQGSGATAATAVGKPVRIGGIFVTTPPTVTTGQTSDLQVGSVGSLHVELWGSNSTTAIGASSWSADALASLSGLAVNSMSRLYNGTNSDRNRSIQGAAATNTGIGVQAVEEAGRTFSNITTATTTTIKSGSGFLHTLTINTTVASGVITIYDNTAGSGTKIATITNPLTLLQMGPLTATYDLAFSTGLTIVTTGAQDITVTYR